MAPKILLTDNPLSAMDIARELAPSGFDTVIARSGSPEFNAALADAEYIVGLGEVKMDDAFYRSAPKLKLVQLLSAGYDRVDIERRAAPRAGVQQRRRQRVAVAEHDPC
jgi:lactate dehydrogenase-like 2-hydroxyacid dehydrogenase